MAEGNGEEVGWLDDLVEAIRAHHNDALSDGGGLSGEHTERLYAACARPFQTGFGDWLYSSPVLMAAALFHGIITGHVFVDGNKRTGSIACASLLNAFDYLHHDPSSLETALLGEVAVETASGGLDVEGAAVWLRRIFGPDPQPEPEFDDA